MVHMEANSLVDVQLVQNLLDKYTLTWTIKPGFVTSITTVKIAITHQGLSNTLTISTAKLPIAIARF